MKYATQLGALGVLQWPLFLELLPIPQFLMGNRAFAVCG